jgi:hypothetical protein
VFLAQCSGHPDSLRSQPGNNGIWLQNVYALSVATTIQFCPAFSGIEIGVRSTSFPGQISGFVSAPRAVAMAGIGQGDLRLAAAITDGVGLGCCFGNHHDFWKRPEMGCVLTAVAIFTIAATVPQQSSWARSPASADWTNDRVVGQWRPVG